MTGSERDRPGRVNPFIRCDLIEGILEDWKLAEEGRIDGPRDKGGRER